MGVGVEAWGREEERKKRREGRNGFEYAERYVYNKGESDQSVILGG